ncbi:hypothetical protein SAMN05446037_1002119 [Anaerovirgula multivorans]|uniref:Uncharacterized protein n=1 Tax=Anaerovirgula multivorans TaxID=312168 RepID=A0A239AN80_9FIRM|nr:hypothetical protein [Anaerovirgula multivorans]SNR96433.1 hypothetical protein SAMN05446037_1002119 [Anaerovirgula multivorans]
MASKYIYKFDIHDIFKTSDEQKIFIGSPKDNSNQFVIINILNEKRFLQQEVKEQLQLLDNLVYFEELNEGIVLATSFNKDVYLTEYIKENKLSIEDRFNLAYQYLKGITKYDNFTNDIKSMLVEESQLTIREGSLLFNELLFIDEDSIDNNSEFNFKRVAQEVGAVLKIITLSNASFLNMKFNAPHEMIGFINDLEYGNHQFQNLSEIFNHFDGFYGRVVYPKHITGEIDELWKKEYNISKKRQFKKKQPAGLIIAIVGIIFIGLTIAMLVIGAGGKSKAMDDVFEEPIAYLEENSMETSGEFTNDSSISNHSNEKSEDLNQYNEVSYSQEILEKYDISYLTPEFAAIDMNVFRSGEYAVKLIGDRKNPVKNFSLNNVNIRENSVISLWIMADVLEEIKLSFQGYKSNDDLKFEKYLYYTPKVLEEWEMIHFDLTAEEITKIEIAILNNNATIWIDDIKIDSYK